MNNKTCRSCKHWVIDVNDKQDKKHSEQDRKLCSQSLGDLAKGHYFHGDTVACRFFSDNERGYKVG